MKFSVNYLLHKSSNLLERKSSTRNSIRMNTILRITKTELRTLFYSPIAWLLLIIFMIQCGHTYIEMLRHVANIQEFGGLNAKYLEMITSRVFLGNSGVFRTVMGSLYLYLPLLTMGLISREMGSGTIKLLYSSPVKVRDIVLGKFLAMLSYCLLLLLIVAVYTLSGAYHIEHAETGMLATALLGFFLLLCAYAAIGLFMSTLTTYQVVAAISTFAVMGVLSHVGNLWQRVEFVRDLTYFLSINGRASSMLNGLVATKDIFYFILIVILFLSFSVYRIKGHTESKPWPIRARRYAGVTVLVLLGGYITSIPALTGYYDATNGKRNTLTPNVQEIIASMADAPIEITSYANLVDDMYFLDNPDSYNIIKSRWDPYFRYNHNITLKKVNYYDTAFNNPYFFQNYPDKTLQEIADMQAKRWNTELDNYLTPAQIRAEVDLLPERNRYVMQVKWKGATAWLRVFDDDNHWPSGTEVGVVLKRLQEAKMPKIAFTIGALERDIYHLGAHGYKTLVNSPTKRNSLVNQGFDAMSLDLETQDIPADVDALVVADPRIELHPQAKQRLLKYIQAGGNLLIAAEPDRRDMINPLLQELGVQLTEGILIQENDYSADVTYQIATPFAGSFYNFLEKYRKEAHITVVSTTGLTWSDSNLFVINPLLHNTPQNTWLKMKPYDKGLIFSAKLDTTIEKKLAFGVPPPDPKKKHLGVVTYTPADGDKLGLVYNTISMTRNINNKEQRIIVSADADLLSNAILSNNPMNYFFSTGVFSYLTGGKYPIDSSRPDPLDNRITITVKEIKRLSILYIWVIPGILFLSGGVLLIRRKRK